MADKLYKIDDPDRVEITLDDISNWLTMTNACSKAATWTNDFLENIHESTPSIDTDHALAAVLNRFIELELYDWTEWILFRIFTVEEAFQFHDYFIERLVDIDSDNDDYNTAKDSAISVSQSAIETSRRTLVAITYQCVIKTCLYSDGNVTALKNDILTYGVGLINNRI